MTYEQVVTDLALGKDAAATLRYLQETVPMTQQAALEVVNRINFPPFCKPARRLDPQLFSFEHQIVAAVEFLRGVPGIKLHECITKSPHILVEAPVSAMERNLRQLGERLGTSAGEMGKLVTKSPTFLIQDLRARIMPFLDKLGVIGFTQQQQKELVLRFPPLLTFSIRKLQGRVAWLQQLGMEMEDVRTVLWKYPSIVCITDASGDRWLEWLRGIGIPTPYHVHIIRRLPMIITYSAEKRRTFMDFMRKEVGLETQDIARILRHTPDTMARTVVRLRSNIEALRAFGLRDDQIRRLVTANPSVLRLDFSSSTYNNKLVFLKEGLEVEDVAEAVVTYPFYVSYRLERIATRTAFLKHIGASYTSIQAWLAMSERRFCEEWCKTSVGEFRAFVLQWRESPEGQHWLGLAADRLPLMHRYRRELEEAQEAQAAELAAADTQLESATATARAQRLRHGRRILLQEATEAAQVAMIVGTTANKQAAVAQVVRQQVMDLERQMNYWEKKAARLAQAAQAEAQVQPRSEQSSLA